MLGRLKFKCELHQWNLKVSFGQMNNESYLSEYYKKLLWVYLVSLNCFLWPLVTFRDVKWPFVDFREYSLRLQVLALIKQL